MKRYPKFLQSFSILLLLMLAPSIMMAQDQEILSYEDSTLESKASFPGGQEELFRFLAKNIRYPLIAEQNGIHGRVVVGFVVDIDGTLSDIKVKKFVDPSLDKEAVRVIKAMPKWIPATKNGKPVRVEYNVPITFRLPGISGQDFPAWITFERDKSSINDSHSATIKRVADHMNKHPQDTIIVIGQARKINATERQRELSDARTKEVIRTLVEDYHINENRIVNGLTVKGFKAVFDADVVIIFQKQKKENSVTK